MKRYILFAFLLQALFFAFSLFNGVPVARGDEKPTLLSQEPAPMKENPQPKVQRVKIVKIVNSAITNSQEDTPAASKKSTVASTSKTKKTKDTPAPTTKKAQPKLIRYAIIDGIRFVNLRDVSFFFGTTYSTKVPKFITLSNKAHRVMLPTKNREGSQDNICVSFFYPVKQKKTNWYISEIDFLEILTPFFKDKISLKHTMKTIMLDPGHGGKDPGAMGKIKNEKQVNLEIAQKLKKKLQKLGFKVYMTRLGDTYPTLDARQNLCKKLKPDIFISIHCNSHDNKNISGVETFLMTPKGAPSTADSKASNVETEANKYNMNNFHLAYEIQKSLLSYFPKTKDRGVKHARFKVLKEASCPAILIESGFISNDQEEKTLTTAASQDKIVEAILTGLIEYKNLLK